jgi:flagellar protein FlaG
VETEPDVLLAKSLQNKNQQPEQIMEANRQQLDDMIDRLNRKLNTMNREIQFRLDEKIGRNYISVIDRKTKEIIKEFPPEEIRNFIARSIEFSTRAGLDDSALKELLISLEV